MRKFQITGDGNMKRATVFFWVLFFIFISCPTEATGQNQYYIKISISQCRLWLYRVGTGQYELIDEYKVCTVKPSMKKFPLGVGHITKIEFNPPWYPTPQSRSYFAKKGIYLPAYVPPGDKLNFMGKFKIHLTHSVPGYGAVYRIHGIRPVDDACIGTRSSGGCVRMRNEEGLHIAQLVSNGTPVEIVP